MSAIAPRTFLVAAILPALDLLPTNMTSTEAKAQMLAHAIQETKLQDRRQVVWNQEEQRLTPTGPARSFYQFELGGLSLMLRHQACQHHAARFVGALGYSDATPPEILDIMVYDSVLASGMARLNLWWHAHPLPKRSDGPEVAWAYYIDTWNPGKPHRHSWDDAWRLAWDTVA